MEEHGQVGFPQRRRGWIRGQPRDPAACRVDVESVGPELPESEFVECREAVQRPIQSLVREVFDLLGQVDGLAVVIRADAIAGRQVWVASEFREGLDVYGPTRNALGEQRQHPVDVGERGQGQTTSTIPATASWTLGSSDTASTMATCAARRGSIRCRMS